MVKKLFKHEFKAWLRIMAVVWAVMLAFAAVYRLFLCFESDSVAYTVISVLAAMIFIIFLSVCIIFCEVFGVVRFYKNLFTGEGYLSFTLPVTAANHLWVKALTTAAMVLITFLMIGVSVLIVTAGDVLTEVWKAAAYLWGEIPPKNVGHMIGYGVEMTVLVLASILFTPMLYYACICIGQLFRKHRVLGAIGVYFGYYYICQIIGTVIMGVLTVFTETVMEETVVEMVAFPYEGFHGLLGGSIVWTVGIGMVYFAICHHIMTKKLNLE